MEELHHYDAKPKKIWTAGTLTYTTSGVVLLFFWLLWGDFAWSMKERAVGNVATLTVQSFGISNMMIGLIITSFPNFTNIFLMPYISYKSDRHRGRLGRRVPFLLAFTPLVVIGLIGLGFTHPLGAMLQEFIGPETISLNIASLIVFFIFWAVLDLGTTLTNALFMALSNDVVPPKLIGRFVALFRMVSLACAVIFNKFIFKYARTEAMYIFLTLAVFYGFGLLFMCTMVREGKYPPPPKEVDGLAPMQRVLGGIGTYFRECFAMPYYRWVIVAWVLCGLSVMPINVYIMPYITAIEMPDDLYGNLQAAVFAFAMIASYLLGWLADRFHPLRTGLITMSVLVVVLLIGGFLIRDVKSFAIVFVTHNIFIMAYNTLVASYGQRLFPRALYAQFNSAMVMVNSLAFVFLPPLVGKIIDLSGDRYYLVFTIGGIFGLSGIGCMLKVYRYYKQLGGDAGYQAPMPRTEEAPAR